jgi:hypothetical protein
MKQDADKLHKIAQECRKWAQYQGQDGTRTPAMRDVSKAVMTLLLDNRKLLLSCQDDYGCDPGVAHLLGWLSGAAGQRGTHDLGSYWSWCNDFTTPRPCGGPPKSFIDELDRWARELESKRNGRPKKYTDDELERMQSAYVKHNRELNNSKAAWNKVAGDFGRTSGNAVRVACMRLK